MIQALTIAIITTGIIALINIAYQLGHQAGEIKALTWTEKLAQQELDRLKEHKRRRDEILADDNGRGSGAGESPEA